LKLLVCEACNVDLEKYSPDFLGCLRQADLSISMGGYNTVMNLLATGVRSLVYPYTANNDQEQYTRARKLERLGVVELLHPEMLVPEVLAQKVAGMLAKTPVTLQVDTDGAANTVLILKSALSGKIERLRSKTLSKGAR
jgi:predicted glycosyltransferase